MPFYDVMVTWEETGQTIREFRVMAPSKKKAAEKATTQFKKFYSRVPENVKYELSDEKVQRHKRKLDPITDLKPVKTCGWAETIKRTNIPGTCLWCGKKLRRSMSWPDKVGHYGDNAFCNKTCGYEFGVTAAVLNFRLSPRDSEVS